METTEDHEDVRQLGKHSKQVSVPRTLSSVLVYMGRQRLPIDDLSRGAFQMSAYGSMTPWVRDAS